MDAMPLTWELPAEDEIATTDLSGALNLPQSGLSLLENYAHNSNCQEYKQSDITVYFRQDACVMLTVPCLPTYSCCTAL